jgi:hypothetical protein
VLNVAALFVTVAMTGVPDQVFFSGMESDSCPEGRILASDVHYDFGGTIASVDVTHFENLWGRISALDTPVAWPGVSGSSPVIEQFTRTGYIAAAFHTPGEMPEMLVGMFKNVSYGGGPALDFSIGSCGDFSTSLGACFVADTAAVDTAMVHWRTEIPTPFFCIVAPDTDYYINIRLSDPDDDALSCSADSCGVTPASYVGY